jgi:hypothetical protein
MSADAAGSTQHLPVTLLDFKLIRRNTLVGFARVRLGRSLIISDITVHIRYGRRWAAMPAKPQISRDGTVLRDDGGKIKYAKVLEWSDRDTADVFSDAVVAAIEAQHPEAFAAAETPQTSLREAPG